MEFFNYSDQEFLEIPTEFRLEKQLAYLHSFVASLHPIWFGHEGDVLIISHQLVPLMLKCFIYIVALYRASYRVSCEGLTIFDPISFEVIGNLSLSFKKYIPCIFDPYGFYSQIFSTKFLFTINGKYLQMLVCNWFGLFATHYFTICST